MTTGKKSFVRAEEGPNNSVIYYDEDGNKLIRYWKKRDDEPVEQASTRSWRNNNPGNHSLSAFEIPVEDSSGPTIHLNVPRQVKGSDIFIEPVSNEINRRLSENKGGDGGFEYLLLEKGEYCIDCSKDFKMAKLGIENISF